MQIDLYWGNKDCCFQY